jgi:hypothetical protein
MPKMFSGIAFVLLSSSCLSAADPNGATPRMAVRDVLWRDPGAASPDIVDEPGGGRQRPRGPFTFVDEDLGGSSPKFVIQDSSGAEWNVKLGKEARAETAATRLLRLAGYFTDEAYLIPVLRVANMPRLRRGQGLVAPGGAMRNARLERSPAGAKRIGRWSWRRGHFTGTRELDGLRVMMALINNWDLKDTNTAVYEKRDPRGVTRIHAVSDLGASFGATGYSIVSRKGDLDTFVRSKFITSATEPDNLDFQTPSRPALVSIFALPHLIYYATRFRMMSIGDDIPREHARWIGQLLSRVSTQQIRQVFEAAGYAPAEVETLAEVIEGRIGQLNELTGVRVSRAQK